MSESVILCEGYDDRAFWAGWLRHFHCEDPGQGYPRKPVCDPEGKEVVAPQFGFYTPTNNFVRIIACQGRANVTHTAREMLRKESARWKQNASEPRLSRLVLSIDPDLSADAIPLDSGFTLTNLCSWLRQFDESATAAERGGEVLIFSGKVAVSWLCWEVAGESSPGIPIKQTLERLVCSAIVAAYPERGEPVHRWLESRPNAPEAGPKEFAWSHMAGWYAKYGSLTFYNHLWSDPLRIEQLRLRLENCGAWQIVEELTK